MVKTDFVLSYLTDSVNDDILDKLVTDKSIDFTISSPDAYWSKQQIKDSYKTPTGGYNKDAFDNDYQKLSKKYEDFQIKRFGDTLLTAETEFFESGGTIPMYQNGDEILEPATSKSKSLTQSEFEQSVYRDLGDYTRPGMGSYKTHKIWNGRSVKTQAGVMYVPDAYTSFTHEGGFDDLAKGKSINELAENNSGVLDKDGNLVTPNLWSKIFDSKFITLDKNGKYQEQISKDGQNLGLDLIRGYTNNDKVVLDKVTAGESVFGARELDDYQWKNRSWYGKIGMGGKLVGEGLLKGGWNMIMGIPLGLTSMSKVMLTTKDSPAPEWLVDTNTFLETQQLRSDVKTDESKWYTPQGFTSGVTSGLGQLGAIAAYTATAIKVGKKLKINDDILAKSLNMTTAIGFGLWGAEGVDNELQAQGITDPNKRKTVQAGTMLLLTGVGSMTNIFLSKLEPNAKKELIKNAVREGMKPITGVMGKLSTDQLVKTTSKAIFDNVNKTVSKMMSQGYKLAKTTTAVDILKEGTQEIAEEIVPDATMLVFPRIYNTLVDSLGGSDEDKFKFNAYGDEKYMDLLDGKTLENYFTAGLFGGITGGIASSIHNRNNVDKNVTYMSALTNQGDDWSEENVDRSYNDLVTQINKEYKKGFGGPTNMGLNKMTMKNEIITEDNKDKVTSYADLIRTQALNDLNIARENVRNLSQKDGFLDQFKSKWDKINKTVESIPAFNKYALSFAEKNTINSYLMNEFKSIVSAQSTFTKNQSKLEKIQQRNDLIKSGTESDLEKAQLIQNEIMGIKEGSKRKTVSIDPSNTADKDRIDLLDTKYAGENEDIQQRLENLNNGVTFTKGLQQAFVRSQINSEIDLDTGRPKFSHVLDVFRSSKDGSSYLKKMNNFNNLNMTSESYIDLKNQEIENEIKKVKDINSSIENEISNLESNGSLTEDEYKLILEEQLKVENDLNKINSEISDIEDRLNLHDSALANGVTNSILSDEELNTLEFELQLKEEEKTKFLNKTTSKYKENASLIENRSKIEELQKKLLPIPNKIDSSGAPYLRRLDPEKFVSLDSSLEDYIKQASEKSKTNNPLIDNPDYVDPNLNNILKELKIRLAQVELNYGSNRKMADYENEFIPQIADLLGLDKTDTIKSYDIGKLKVKSIEYGKKNSEGNQPKLNRDGSKSFLAIYDPSTYLETKSKLESLINEGLRLKKLSDNNTPDINQLIMVDDLVHIESQLELFSSILSNPVELTEAKLAISFLIKDGRALPNVDINRDLINKFVSLLNDQEYTVHVKLNEKDSKIESKIQEIREEFINKKLQFGYNAEQFQSFIRNIKNNNIREFFGVYGTEVNTLSKVPSFTQLETIKHTFWNLTNSDEIKSVISDNTFQNAASIWAYQGAGKTTIVGAMVAKLYNRHIAAREIYNVTGGKEITDKLIGFTFSGKYFKNNGNNYVYTKIDTDGTIKNVYIDSSNSIKPLPKDAKLIDSSKILIAAEHVKRIFSLEEEFEKAGLKTTRVNSKDTSLDEIASSNNGISYLTSLLTGNSLFTDYNLVVIDEATTLSSEQLNTLKQQLERINKDRKPPLKVLFMGDLKQAGNVSGFQGDIPYLNSSIVSKDGINQTILSFDNDSRRTSWFADSTKELKVKFRTGNQSINDTISYFRDKDYLNPTKKLIPNYYQGREGLKGMKISSSDTYELQDIVSKIKSSILTTSQISKSDVAVITTSNKMKETIVKTYPELDGVVYLVEEIQGDTKDYVIFIPDPEYVYGYSKTNPSIPGKHELVSAEEANKIGFSSEFKLTSDFFDTDKVDNVISRNLSTTNLGYQLEFSTISALGRARKYACLVVSNPNKNSILGSVSESGNSGSVSSLKDIFTYKPMTPFSTDSNRKKQNELIKEESRKYSGSKVDDITPSGTTIENEVTLNSQIPKENTNDVYIKETDEYLKSNNLSVVDLVSSFKSQDFYVPKMEGLKFIKDENGNFKSEKCNGYVIVQGNDSSGDLVNSYLVKTENTWLELPLNSEIDDNGFIFDNQIYQEKDGILIKNC